MKSSYSLQHSYWIPSLLKSTPITTLVVAVLYILLSKISFILTIPPGTVSPIFLPAGFALASVLILGRKPLIGIWLGSLCSNLFLSVDPAKLDQTHFLNNLPQALCISVSHIIASLIGVFIVNRLCKKEFPLSNGKNVLTLLLLASVAYSTITSLIGVISLTHYNSVSAEQFWYTYKTWWLGDTTGIILITPLILSWSLKGALNKNKIKLSELLLYLLMTIILCFAIFFQYYYLKYLIFPLLFWSAYRFGIQITTLLIIIISSFAILTTTQGIGPFNEESINDSVLVLDFFLSVITICSLFLAGIISERQKAEEDLIRSEEKYRNIFENIQDVIFQTDPNGIFLNLSPSAKNFAGYTSEELIGKSTNILQVDDEVEDSAIKEINQKLALKNFEKKIKTKSGDLIWISLDAKMIFDENGNKHHIDAFVKDITQRKENQKEIASQNNKLQIQNKELEQLAYITSHDLHEPLITLKSFSELLKAEFTDNSNENSKQYLDFIMQSSDRMQKLVKGLLDYTRIGKQAEITDVDCNEIVEKVIASLSDIIQKTDCQITTENLPKIKGYLEELILLFQNLIENAIKFKKENTSLTINISAKKNADNWEFIVKDNGIGIEEHNKEKAFAIFKRLNNRDEYTGIGIGLALCKKIITMHGGDIWIESIFGKGTSIHFTIVNSQKTQKGNLQIK